MKLSSKVKEKVARTIGEFFTTNTIVNVFSDANIVANRELFAKWHITLDAFSQTKSVEGIFEIIEEFCHPLNFDESIRREVFINALNKVLAYDGLEIKFSEQKAKVQTKQVEWEPFIMPSQDSSGKSFTEMELIETANTEIGQQLEAKDKEKIAENKELLHQLRDFHQAFMDVIETFCQNIKRPNKELNDSYIFLMRKIQDTIQKLDLQYHTLTLYKPFKDLYSAEMEWNGTGNIDDIRLNPKLSWDAVRPSLHKTHSDIVKICALAEEDSEMTDDQKKLEEIAGLVAKARTERTDKTTKQRVALPIEIINPVQISKEVHTKVASPLTQRTAPNLKADLKVGDLEAFNDGSIRYKGTPIEMRNQLKDLCRLFMGRPNRLVTIDEITEELIRADKRKTTSHTTISKYVSELRAILMNHFKKDVLTNQKEEGWFFKP